MTYRTPLIVAAAACTLLVPAVQAATTLSGGSTALSTAVAIPGSPRIVKLVAPGQLQVSAPGAAVRTITVPFACSLSVAMTASEAFVCGGEEGDPIAVDLVTGAQRRLPARTPLTKDKELFTATRAGSRWLEGQIELSGAEFGNKGFTIDVIVDRTTGREIDVNGSFSPDAKSWGARRYVNLDSARPDQTLCSPVTRSAIADATYGDLVKVGSWTVRQSAGGSVLQRCGSTKTTRISAQQVVLGRKHVAWIQGRHVTLRTLATGRTRTFALTHSQGTLALSSNRLVISQIIARPPTYTPLAQVNTIPID
jgi:hypothetical protein